LLGFRRLGFDVTFIDVVDHHTKSGTGYVNDVLTHFGFGKAYAVLNSCGSSVAGLGRGELLERVRASLLLNVMGYVRDADLLGAASRRIFLDIDPGYPQMWRDLGLADLLCGHDNFVTIAERIGSADCEIPTCRVEWITTRQPVVLEHFPKTDGGRVFTTVATWRGPYGVVDYAGRSYGSRVHEFRKFVGLPTKTTATFELALDIYPEESADKALLGHNRWRLVSPRDVVADPAAYRRYIQQSRAEICVAKNMYVDTRGGWVSDRSVCYLASGKPVLAQETGFSESMPTGDGLVAFSTLDEAVAGVEAIEAEYEYHSAAARELAEEYFDSDLVLADLLEKIGVA
jgi:hypothetical protein